MVTTRARTGRASIRYDPRVQATVAATGTSEQLLGVRCRGGEAFAVGTRGTILRWDGRAWTPEVSGTDEDLYAVECAGDAVVAVGGNLHIGGDSLVLHRRDGWIAEPSGMQHILLAVAHGGQGWFAAGYNGGMIRGAPGSWSRVEVVHYSHVFALLAVDARVFAAGLTGTVIEFDGAAWRPHDTRTEAHLRGLAVFPSLDVVAVGLSGTILRYDGRRWAPMDCPTKSHLEAVWAPGEDEAYAVGYAGCFLRFDGKRWAQVDVGVRANLHSVHGSDDEVVAVGGGGAAVHLKRKNAAFVSIDGR
jgi:hypothetical protein